MSGHTATVRYPSACPVLCVQKEECVAAVYNRNRRSCDVYIMSFSATWTRDNSTTLWIHNEDECPDLVRYVLERSTNKVS